MKPKSDADGVRITQQFRSGQAMVYDLRGAGGSVSLRVTGRAETDAGPPTEWRIEASTSSSPGAVVVSECGVTRADALKAVGHTWSEKRLACCLPLFDWELVALAMRSVRAV